MMNNWESVTEVKMNHYTTIRTDRLRVQGGWILRTIVSSWNSTSDGCALSNAVDQIFVAEQES